MQNLEATLKSSDLLEFPANCYNNNLTVGETEYLNRNLGKQVTILLYDGKEETLYIKGACKIADAFRYVGHKAKNPRTKLEIGDGLHFLIYKGYYFFPAESIIL